jgi:uncharacterized protein (DUF488 family)
MTTRALWTVGHSNQPFEALTKALRRERIEFVADVRSYPYSRFAPHFNREEMQSRLQDHGIRYIFLGDELGGRPSKPEHYDPEGHALYGPMSKEPEFQEAIDRLLEGALEHRIALICSEKDPRHCHRRLLVGKVLAERGVELHHMLPDGSIWTETEVSLDAGAQSTLFGEGEVPWRSTQSVSHRRRLSTSSAA